MVNVVGGVVILTVGVVVPLVLARAALALVMSLMSPGRAAESPVATHPEPASNPNPAIAH